MSDDLISLKIDRILANQDRILAGQRDHGAALAALTAGVEVLADGMDTLRETVAELAKAASAEPESGLHDILVRMLAQLEQIAADSARTVEVLHEVPQAAADAAVEAIRMAAKPAP